MASDGVHNLKGENKAVALVERFGEKGFSYAGNDGSDLPVWARAKSAVIVNASASLAAKAAHKVDVEWKAERISRLGSLVRALRPYQWVKNLLVFVPLMTAHATDDAAGWLSAIWTFLAFCTTASGIYI